MRHRVAGRKLGRTTSHRIAMTRNMATSLIEHERIITTIQKAKTVKPFVEKLVTSAKEATQHHRRLAFAKLRDKAAVEKLFDVLGPRFYERPGGYCRILRLNKPRLGDNGQRVVLEFVERSVVDEEVSDGAVADEAVADGAEADEAVADEAVADGAEADGAEAKA